MEIIKKILNIAYFGRFFNLSICLILHKNNVDTNLSAFKGSCAFFLPVKQFQWTALLRYAYFLCVISKHGVMLVKQCNL